MTLTSQPSFLKKNLFSGVTPVILLVIAIMALSFGLHMFNIQSIGDANMYYTAAVKSMLQSWSNFFFVAAEPGGSVAVDKSPLGLWIEAVFAYFLGVSGFSVSLPNILAGVFGIPILYYLVKKYAGELAGLIAAFVMATTPVYVATNRNNTMDGLLVFFLLMAAWVFMQATETGKLRWLLLGAFIVGLGFNIKMLQAFLPLPAFYALYFFGSKETWIRKSINLGVATVLLIAISLSWAVIVDLTPADQRPYIGSSDNNTVMGLIFGHNGIKRLEGGGGPQNDSNPGQGIPPQDGTRPTPPPEALAACANLTQGADCSFQGRDRTVNGTCIAPPNLNQLACAPQGMIPKNGQAPNGQPPAGGTNGGGSTPFSNETGNPGILRFFTSPLSKQMSWLLPFALISMLLAIFGSRIQLPIESGVHKALFLWGGWLLTCVVLFSTVSGIFHAYYAIMLAPALGAMVGIGFAQLWSWGADKKWAGVVLIVSAALTVGFQCFAMIQYGETLWWMLGSGLVFASGVFLMFVQERAAYVTILAAMLVIPVYWTVMTVMTDGNQRLPTAYMGSGQQQTGIDRARQQPGTNQSGPKQNTELLTYLEANTPDLKYLLAVPSSDQGAQFVIATGRPVLYMGGFNGKDDVVGVDDLKAMVANGELRYIMYSEERGTKTEITNWLQTSCVNMIDFAQTPQQLNALQGPGDQQIFLYRCE